MQQGDYANALKEFNRALKENNNSSLAHYRIAEVFFLQHNYQASANAYRESSTVMASRAGQRSGATSSLARSST